MSQGMDPFERQELIDKPGIVGAKWWHATLVDEAAKVARRDAIRSILIAGGVIAGFGALLGMCVKAVSDDAPETKDDRKTTLDMQKDYGWDFGAIGEPLVFDGQTYKPFEPSAIANLRSDLRPRRSELRPYFQGALFDSPDATPGKLASVSPDDAAAFKKLETVLKPIESEAMKAAYARGRSVASLFLGMIDAGQKVRDAKTALVVDLPGPEAVAFAAGASLAFDPVFLFDNWPHPRGVVRAHETLSAAAFYQPIFAQSPDLGSSGRLPMFVLDRRRLTTYTDDATQFDNRYVAKLPWPAVSMSSLGVSHILYVVPTARDANVELDDLNDDFVAYSKGGMDVKIVPLDQFGPAAPSSASQDPKPPPGDAGAMSSRRPPAKSASDAALESSGWVYYGGSPLSHFNFFKVYGLGPPPRPATASLPSTPGSSYVPSARKTAYSVGTGAPVEGRPRPTSFATVPVVVAVGTGVILGARYARSGSWNRSSGGWGG